MIARNYKDYPADLKKMVPEIIYLQTQKQSQSSNKNKNNISRNDCKTIRTTKTIATRRNVPMHAEY